MYKTAEKCEMRIIEDERFDFDHKTTDIEDLNNQINKLLGIDDGSLLKTQF
jgi:hypothetical protein